MNSYILLLSIIVMTACNSLNPQQDETIPVSHDQFTELLKIHVNEEGMVDYQGFMGDRDALNGYLELISSNAPNDTNWSDADQIAYWINLYNAYTIDLILDYYPVESIKDIGSSIQVPFVNTPWDIKFIKINGEEYDLNNIEHNILRKNWKEPRIHFAVNCASFSCPKLRREAYEGASLEEQLDDQARVFINDDTKNNLAANKASLSKIFDWFAGDFKEVMPVKQFVNQYADIKISEDTEINYMEYDWSLNNQND